METLFWILEYGKVFCGYLFLMFLWPSVVFHEHLKAKARSYRFGFCVTTQIVIINTVVLILGLFHILNQITVIFFFYGIFAYAVLRRIVCAWRSKKSVDDQKNSGKRFPHLHFSGVGGSRPVKQRIRNIRLRGRELLWVLHRKIQPWTRAYGLLGVVVIFGMIYFTYGAFQVRSYGWGDLYAHHEWIYGLIQGNIFSGGVYPEAMHCFIYCVNMLFGIRVYSILAFLQGIHVAVFLLSAYLLLREVFHWKYSPVFALMLFLTLDVVSAEQVYSLFRLQITLPLEFGLHTQFLCAVFLVRYLKNESSGHRETARKYCWDENLFLFMMSLTASIVIHFYTTAMAFLLCLSFALFALKKIFNKKQFIPLAVCVICGCLIAILPMAGALASGIPFNYSIDWAVGAMNGEETRQLRDKVEKASETEEEDPNVQAKGIGIQNWKEVKENSTRFFGKSLPAMYRHSYPALYGERRTRWILALTGMAILLCITGRLRPCHRLRWICGGYPPLIVFTFFFLVTYAMPYGGYPELFPDSRFCSVGHLMILAVTVMPFDTAFSLIACVCRASILRMASAAVTVGIYVVTIFTGNYRGFLFYELTRYNSTVDVTNSIIDTFPAKGYTVVAPTDELYPVIEYGWHEELQTFVEKCAGTEYIIPTEYVFLYVEKKPLLYAQAHFFQGPSWLGEEKYEPIYWGKYSQKYPNSGASQAPEIKASMISGRAALEKDLQTDQEEPDDDWLPYIRLEDRTTLESKAYDWCQKFSERHPSVLDVYYEDEEFVCYYFRQDADALYNLCLD